jgi:signal transduction histidine kinase
MFVDITDRERMEQELLTADKKKNEFISILAHELRNPLAPILSNAELLRAYLIATGNEERELHDMADVISRQVSNMSRLLDDLLDVSRILRDKIQLQKERVDLRLIVSRALETCRSSLESKLIDIDLSQDGELVVYADPVRIEQIIVNIINNAVKFSGAGSRLWITVGRQESEALVCIRDEGQGISADLLPRIFELFTQGQQGESRDTPGLGVGLGLAKRFVEMHGGTIHVKSEGAGKGSEFIVTLPAGKS